MAARRAQCDAASVVCVVPVVTNVCAQVVDGHQSQRRVESAGLHQRGQRRLLLSRRRHARTRAVEVCHHAGRRGGGDLVSVAAAHAAACHQSARRVLLGDVVLNTDAGTVHWQFLG
jgi:hypothetical protein